MKYAGTLEIAAAMALWSSWGIFVRWLPIPPWAITFYVGVIACACAAGCWVARGRSVRALWPESHRGALVAMGLLFLANNVCFLTAYERTTVANAVLTHYTAPVFVAVLAPLTIKERLLPATPLALGFAAVGMGLLLPGVELTWKDRHLQGLGLGTMSGLAYAGLILMARHLSLRVQALPLIFFQNFVIAGFLFPAAVVLGLPRTGETWAKLAVLGVVHATCGGVLYLVGIRKIGAQVAAILGYLEPLGAVLLAAVLLGERPPASGFLGGGLILAGGGLVVWDESRRSKPVDARDGRR